VVGLSRDTSFKRWPLSKGKEDSKERDVGYENQYCRPSPEKSLCYVGALIREVHQVLFVYVSPCLLRSCSLGTLDSLSLSLMKPAHGKLCDRMVKRSTRSGHMFTWI
jgi:hypothetical protein